MIVRSVVYCISFAAQINARSRTKHDFHLANFTQKKHAFDCVPACKLAYNQNNNLYLYIHINAPPHIVNILYTQYIIIFNSIQKRCINNTNTHTHMHKMHQRVGRYNILFLYIKCMRFMLLPDAAASYARCSS